MMEAIRRVISGEDMHGDSSTNNDDDDYDDGIGMQIDDDEYTPSQGPALVENDAADFHIASASETPRSSLSDMSAEQRLQPPFFEDETEAYADEDEDARVTQTIQPADSRQPTMSTLAPKSADRLSDESSSVGKTGSSQTSSRDWGWFEDVHASDGGLVSKESPASHGGKKTKDSSFRKKKTATTTLATMRLSQGIYHETLQPLVTRDPETDAAAMAVTAPNYVLEESLSSQRLWKDTAGQRPPQPIEERAFFEKMWAQNFARSQVEYQMPVEVLTATTPISLNPFADGNFDSQGAAGNELSNYNLAETDRGETKKKQHPSDMAEAALIRKLYEPRADPQAVDRQVKMTTSDGDTLTVLVKGDNVFGTTVSKSFARPSDNGGPIKGVDTVNISIASYRVVESKKHGKYAQFLVIYREGSIRDTIGVWKRYSDFQELSRKVTQAHEGCTAVIANMSPLAVAEEHEVEHLPNAITSWRLLKKRQRWYRCLDAGYLSLKVFLLERFLHDILFESSSPDLLRDFVGVAEPQ